MWCPFPTSRPTASIYPSGSAADQEAPLGERTNNKQEGELKILTYPDAAIFHASPSCEGKFLQLRWRGEDHLIFAIREVHRYHNQILGEFLRERGIPHRWPAPDRLEVEHPDLEVIGGGRFQIDWDADRLRLWDNSQAYGRFREQGLREGLAVASLPWSLLAVIVD